MSEQNNGNEEPKLVTIGKIMRLVGLLIISMVVMWYLINMLLSSVGW